MKFYLQFKSFYFFNAFENIVCKKPAILFRPRCVNRLGFSFQLHLQKYLTAASLEEIPSVQSPALEVKCVGGKVIWETESAESGGYTVRITVTPYMTPVKVWVSYPLYKVWQSISLPQVTTPFPVYTYPHSGFVQFWEIQDFFRSLWPSGENLVKGGTKIRNTTFTVSPLFDSHIKVIADVFLPVSSGFQQLLSARPCTQLFEGHVPRWVCPDGGMVQLKLVQPASLLPSIPDICVRSFSRLGDREAFLAYESNLAWFYLILDNPLLLYSAFFVIGQCVTWYSWPTASRSDTSNRQVYVVFSTCVILLAYLGYDLASRGQLGVCHAIYDRSMVGSSFWLLYQILALVYPTIILCLVFLPFVDYGAGLERPFMHRDMLVQLSSATRNRSRNGRVDCPHCLACVRWGRSVPSWLLGGMRRLDLVVFCYGTALVTYLGINGVVGLPLLSLAIASQAVYCTVAYALCRP